MTNCVHAWYCISRHHTLDPCVSDGAFVVVRLLWGAEADKDKAAPNGATALMLAPAAGHLEMVCLLGNTGGGQQGQGNIGWYPALLLASDNRHMEAVRLLWRAGAYKDKDALNGATVLMQASASGTWT
jgi:ankyrin repeat protein